VLLSKSSHDDYYLFIIVVCGEKMKKKKWALSLCRQEKGIEYERCPRTSQGRERGDSDDGGQESRRESTKANIGGSGVERERRCNAV